MPTTLNGDRTTRTSTAGKSSASSPRRRLAALGRAEWTLLIRNRTALFVALLMPLLMVVVTKSSLDGVDLDKAGMSVVEAALTAGVGMVLLLVVHLNLVSAYVARREELVLKRLRTGEVPDHEILVGTALPAIGLALTQCVLLVVGGVVGMDLSWPRRPDLLIGGIIIGVVLLTALAAVTATVTRTVESTQITTMPMFLVSVAGSGLLVPLEVMPEKMASVCELLPVTGVMTLVRAGWLGGADSTDVMRAVLISLVWMALSVFAVSKWFRWEPRR
ncbi:ABC transporter permease [Streptomyces sp. NBC_00690]|uniref:ABC transporter permease n=1 Tax=Streptomyces sp. NBC_00690 TaxID=2975808 RepID=UPI002E285D97|nr:ABC transporter permease [Streptomyces sp. NBC_00690]